MRPRGEAAGPCLFADRAEPSEYLERDRMPDQGSARFLNENFTGTRVKPEGIFTTSL